MGIETAITKQPFDIQTKDIVSDFLSNCKIEMFVHPLSDFLSSTNLQLHNQNREFREKIENELISYLKGKVGEDRLLNKKIAK